MSGDAIRRPTVEELHDRHLAAREAFLARPCPATALQWADAYARFYRAFNNGSSSGLDVATAQLWRNMLGEMQEAKAV